MNIVFNTVHIFSNIYIFNLRFLSREKTDLQKYLPQGVGAVREVATATKGATKGANKLCPEEEALYVQ